VGTGKKCLTNYGRWVIVRPMRAYGWPRNLRVSVGSAGGKSPVESRRWRNRKEEVKTLVEERRKTIKLLKPHEVSDFQLEFCRAISAALRLRCSENCGNIAQLPHTPEPTNGITYVREPTLLCEAIDPSGSNGGGRHLTKGEG